MSRQEYTTRVGKALFGGDAVEDQPYPLLKKNGKWTIPSAWYDFSHLNEHTLLRARFDTYFK